MLRTLAALALAATLSGCAFLPIPKPPHAAPPPAELGSEVRDGRLAFVVSKVGPPEHWFGQPPAGEWIMAEVSVRNVGDGPQAFSVGNVALVDSEGREYAPTVPPSFAGHVGAFMVDLNPGFDTSAQVMFDVPPGTAVSQVELHDVASSAGARVAVG
jgi:hypothetical protein